MKQSIYLFLFLFIFSACQSQSVENTKISAQKKEKQKTQQEQKDTKTAKWTENAIIYEVNIRHFSEKGNFEGLGKQLGRLKKMGVDVVCLTPIQPIGKKNRQGKMGNPYAVQDFKNVNPNFGKMEDFITLVKRIHQLGMHVIIDWSATAALDNELAQKHEDWFLKNTKNISDVIVFDYEKDKVQSYMLDALQYWVKKTDIDGFRCVNVTKNSADFWEKAKYTLSSIKPVFMVASSEKSDFKTKAFDAIYSNAFYKTIKEIENGKKNASDLSVVLKEEEEGFGTEAKKIRFTTMESEKNSDFGQADRSFSVLSYVMPDFPLLLNGQEAAFDNNLEAFEKGVIDWKNYELQAFYTQLAKLKHDNVALRSSEMFEITNSEQQDVFAFSRTKDGDTVVAIFNLSDKKKNNIEFRMRKEIEGKYLDFFSGKETAFDSKTKMSLEAWEYKILVFGK